MKKLPIRTEFVLVKAQVAKSGIIEFIAIEYI